MKDYDGYNFEVFRRLAKTKAISKYEKIGFPDSYRNKVEGEIFEDILRKVPLIGKKNKLNILDIGPGCSDLPNYIIDFCCSKGHNLFLADSEEILALIPNKDFIYKIPGLFPNTQKNVKELSGGIDVIICYSVLHYIFVDSNICFFLDSIMDLMNDGAQCLIGDIPNISKRKRFFASKNGIKFHKKFMRTIENPEVEFNRIEKGKIDDSLLNSMTQRCQLAGFDAYLVPQSSSLPFANRRDDFIIRRP